ncbi:MAG: hypothetical protein HYS41_00670 [Candidatus Omnitrophica bacterium]|nr:hypothetical protein [Candidatus Omnitrophota bacterium]
MDRLRLRDWLLVLGLLGFSVFLLPLIPALPLVFDPAFLLLVFLGFQKSRGAPLWLIGAGLGFLKDLAGGGPFGAWLVSFALIGWILTHGRHLVEWEDPLVQSLAAALLTGLGWTLYGLLVVMVDPEVGWNRWWWFWWPSAMGVHGAAVYLIFPKLKRI